jgi:transcriptional regulator with XRE-family HTH domain
MAISAGAFREPQAKRQRLGDELLRLRDLAGLSGRDLAQRIGISQSKVSRIETGRAVPSIPEVTAWADAVGTTVEARDRLRALTDDALVEVHTWRAAAQPVPPSVRHRRTGSGGAVDPHLRALGCRGESSAVIQGSDEDFGCCGGWAAGTVSRSAG